MSAFTQAQEQRIREIVAEVLAERNARASRISEIVDAVTQSSDLRKPDQPHSRGCD